MDTGSYKTIERTAREIFPQATVVPSLVVVGTDSRHFSEEATVGCRNQHSYPSLYFSACCHAWCIAGASFQRKCVSSPAIPEPRPKAPTSAVVVGQDTQRADVSCSSQVTCYVLLISIFEKVFVLNWSSLMTYLTQFFVSLDISLFKIIFKISFFLII